MSPKIRKTPIPIKRTPVPKKSLGLVRGDLVEVLVRDRTMDCAYRGQTGRVLRFEQGFFVVLLKCGHTWFFDKEALHKVGHQDQVVIKRFGKLIGGGEPDDTKPVRRRKMGRRKVK